MYVDDTKECIEGSKCSADGYRCLPMLHVCITINIENMSYEVYIICDMVADMS